MIEVISRWPAVGALVGAGLMALPGCFADAPDRAPAPTASSTADGPEMPSLTSRFGEASEVADGAISPDRPLAPGRQESEVEKFAGKGGAPRPPRAAVELPPQSRLDVMALQRAVDGRFDRMARCIQVDTVAKVSLAVEASGELGQVTVLTSTPDSPLLRDCLRAALSGARVVGSSSDGKPFTMNLMLRKAG